MLNMRGMKWGKDPRTSNVYREIKHGRYQMGQEIQFCHFVTELAAYVLTHVYTQIYITKCVLHIAGHVIAKPLCRLGQFCLHQYTSNCGSADVYFEYSYT